MKERQANKKGSFIDNVEAFFKDVPAIDIDPDADIKSTQEEETLFQFTGNFKNFTEYLQHEEFIIKKLDKQSERILREKNAKLAFQFSSIWAVFIAMVIILKGFGNWYWLCFELSQTEFLFIIGTLTTSIFTFYTLVLRYLFYGKLNENKTKVI